eukprot:757678-Hanusia_phi.AAC.1
MEGSPIFGWGGVHGMERSFDGEEGWGGRGPLVMAKEIAFVESAGREREEEKEGGEKEWEKLSV